MGLVELVKENMILSLVVLLGVYYVFIKREFFEGLDGAIKSVVGANVASIELKQPDIPISPPQDVTDVRSIMSGSGYIPQKEVIPPWGDSKYGANEPISADINDETMGMHFLRCSKSCCAPQFPTPHKIGDDSALSNVKGDMVPNNMTCNNSWDSAGCVCMPKKNADFISSRGNNA